MVRRFYGKNRARSEAGSSAGGPVLRFRVACRGAPPLVVLLSLRGAGMHQQHLECRFLQRQLLEVLRSLREQTLVVVLVSL